MEESRPLQHPPQPPPSSRRRPPVFRSRQRAPRGAIALLLLFVFQCGDPASGTYLPGTESPAEPVAPKSSQILTSTPTIATNLVSTRVLAPKVTLPREESSTEPADLKSSQTLTSTSTIATNPVSTRVLAPKVPLPREESSTEPAAPKSSQTLISTSTLATTLFSPRVAAASTIATTLLSPRVTIARPKSRNKTLTSLQSNSFTTTSNDSFKMSSLTAPSKPPEKDQVESDKTSTAKMSSKALSTESVPTTVVSTRTTARKETPILLSSQPPATTWDTSSPSESTEEKYVTTTEKPWREEDYALSGLEVLVNKSVVPRNVQVRWNPPDSIDDEDNVSYEVEVRFKDRDMCDCGKSRPGVAKNIVNLAHPEWSDVLDDQQWYYVRVRAGDDQNRKGSWNRTQEFWFSHPSNDSHVNLNIDFNDTSATASWEYVCSFVGDIVRRNVSLFGVGSPNHSTIEEQGCSGTFSWWNLEVDTNYTLEGAFTFYNGIENETRNVQTKNFKTDAKVPGLANCDVLVPLKNNLNFLVNLSCLDQAVGTYRLAVILVGHVLPKAESREISSSPMEDATSLPSYRDYQRGGSKYFAIVTKSCSQMLSYQQERINCNRTDCETGLDHCSGDLSSGTYYYRLRYYTRAGYRDSEDKSFSVPVSSTVIILICLCFLIVIMIALIAYILLRNRIPLRKTRSMEMLVVPPPPSGRSACRPIAIGDLPQVVLALFTDRSFRLRQEYEELKLISPVKATSIARLRDNMSKNRYANILPYDDTRVRLQLLPTDPYSDYINASYVNGYDKVHEYIACQGPKKENLNEFWRMIWEKEVQMIVMVTRCVEGKDDTVKCHKYWPDANNVFGLDLKDICMTVKTLMETAHDPGGYVMRKIELAKNSQRRTVQQMHFVAWPDMGCPESPEQLICFLRSVKDYTPLDSRHTIVHCSAGVGRTGTFIGLDILMSAIENEDHVDVFNTVYRMRASRTNMVQTESQYAFLYKCLLKLYNDMHDEAEGPEVIEPSILDVQ